MRFFSSVSGLGLRGWGTIAGIVASTATVAAFALSLGDDGSQNSSTSTPARSQDEREVLATRYIENFHTGAWSNIWQDLHPAEQELVSEDRYVECQVEAGATASLYDQAVTAKQSIPIDIPGIDQRTATIVSVRVKLGTVGGKPVSRESDVYMVGTEDGWKLLLPPFEQQAFEDGRCPSEQDYKTRPPRR